MLSLVRTLALGTVLAVAACKGDGKSTDKPSPAETATQAASTTAEVAPTPTPTPTPPAASACTGNKDGIPACEAACATGDAHACGIAGELHMVEDDEAVAEAKAAPLFVKACEGGDGEGCHWLGVFHGSGLGGIAKDETQMTATYARALGLLEKECVGGAAVPCHMAAGLHSSGQGGATDKAKALEYWTKGCALGNRGSCDQVKKAGGTP